MSALFETMLATLSSSQSEVTVRVPNVFEILIRVPQLSDSTSTGNRLWHGSSNI